MFEFRGLQRHSSWSRVLYFLGIIFNYSELARNLEIFAVSAITSRLRNCKHFEVPEQLKVIKNFAYKPSTLMTMCIRVVARNSNILNCPVHDHYYRESLFGLFSKGSLLFLSVPETSFGFLRVYRIPKGSWGFLRALNGSLGFLKVP